MSFKSNFLRYWKTLQIVLLYLISIILVFLMYPREGKFQYEYVKNTPWLHQDLIAPFDFPVYKDEHQLNREIDSITKNSLSYFQLDTSVILSVYGDYQQDTGKFTIDKDLGRVYMRNHKLLLDTLPGLLNVIYDAGIIEMHPVIQVDNFEEVEVIVLSKQIAEETALPDLLTEKDAYEYLLNSLVAISSISSDQILSELSISNYIRPNILYDQSMTENVLNSKLDEIVTTQGMVQSGQIIIARGELVSPIKFRLVESLRQEYETNPNVNRNYSMLYLGQFILIAMLFLSLLWYVINFRKDLMNSSLQTIFLLTMILIMVALTKVTISNENISFYVIPFAIVPIFLKTFFNVRFALFVHFLILLLAGFWIPNSYQFLLMNFLAGVVAVFSMHSYYRRGTLFYIAMFVALTYSLIYVIQSLLQEGTFEGVNWTEILWFGGNGLLILTVYPLIYIFERMFGFLSDATLFELSDTNQPLLRQLAEKAPGTMQHSLQVSNMAEEAVRTIGGNPLLVRTGALYHDIGKMENPFYYIENQRDGENPHTRLDFKTSAQIIIEHVSKGVEIAKKHKLPEKIIDFIRTHHGTSTVQYFYRSYINTNPDEEVNEADFTYPGPKPSSKEMAVLMLADSVEAASRSVKELNEESLNQLVDKIVEHQTSEDQYAEADITFSDITTIKKIFKQKLINMYHARIAYPT